VNHVGDIGGMPLWFNVPEAGRLFFGLSERSSYAQAHRYLDSNGAEGLPCVRMGGRLICPTGCLLKGLGFNVDVSITQAGTPSLGDDAPGVRSVIPLRAGQEGHDAG